MPKKTIILLMVILIIGAGLRCYNPTFRSLWGDEGNSVYNALGVPHNVLGSLVKDSHLPVYFIMLAVWMKCFGLGELSLRSMSILLSLITLLVMWRFARELFTDQVALLATLLLAVSPLAIMHAQEIRMYGLLMLLSLLSTLYFRRCLAGSGRTRELSGYFIFSVLLVLTHIYAVLILIAQFLFLLTNYGRAKDRAKLSAVLTMQMLVAVLAAPLYFKIFAWNLPQLTAGTSDLAFAVFPAYLKAPLIFFVLSLGETVAPWNFFLVGPAGLIFAGLFLTNWKDLKDQRVVFLMLMCLVPIVLAALLKTTMPKYLVLVLPFYLLLIGHALASLKSKALAYGLFTVLIILQLVSVANYYLLREYHNANQLEPWRAVAGKISQEFQPGDVIIATNRFVPYRLLFYYLNMSGSRQYPLYSLQPDIYTPDGKYRYYDEQGRARSLPEIAGSRIWLVTQIGDDRGFPAGYLGTIRNTISKRFLLVSEEKYIPYEETLVVQLPIKRHLAGASRITVDLYRRWP